MNRQIIKLRSDIGLCSIMSMFHMSKLFLVFFFGSIVVAFVSDSQFFMSNPKSYKIILLVRKLQTSSQSAKSSFPTPLNFTPSQRILRRVESHKFVLIQTFPLIQRCRRHAARFTWMARSCGVHRTPAFSSSTAHTKVSLDLLFGCQNSHLRCRFLIFDCLKLKGGRYLRITTGELDRHFSSGECFSMWKSLQRQ